MRVLPVLPASEPESQHRTTLWTSVPRRARAVGLVADRVPEQAQERTVKAAERLEEAQAREREAADALDAARSELGALERG